MSNYYNENNPKAAATIRELIKLKLIPNGTVDDRSITDVSPADLRGFTQCHFFAGVAGWSLALRVAGFPEDRHIWSMSCPCQPFSDAGLGKGTADERHLWPVAFNLVSECKPSLIIGEQVSSKAALSWFDGVCSDLEGAHYACGAVDICAAGIGETRHPLCVQSASVLREIAQGTDIGDPMRGELLAGADFLEGLLVGGPHIRSRLYWLGHASGSGREELRGNGQQQFQVTSSGLLTSASGTPCAVADAPMHGCAQHEHESREGPRRGTCPHDAAECGGSCTMANANRPELRGLSPEHGEPLHPDNGGSCPMGNAPSDDQRRAGQSGESKRWNGEAGGSSAFRDGLEHSDSTGRQPGEFPTTGAGHGAPSEPTGGDGDRLGHAMREGRTGQSLGLLGAGNKTHWSDFTILPCLDGKARRVESGTFPLVAGVPRGVGHSSYPGLPISAAEANATAEGRVSRLHSYGNAICIPVAATFIETVMEILP